MRSFRFTRTGNIHRIISATGLALGLLLATSCQGVDPPSSSLPIAPEGLVCTSAADGKSISLSWSSIETVTSYCVYRADSGSETFKKLASISTTSYTDSTTTPGASYRYALSSVNSVGEGSKGKAVSATAPKPLVLPAAPQGLACASASDGNSVTLSWSALENADDYVVYRAASGSTDYTERGKAASASYKDETTCPGGSYNYAVSGRNSLGEGPKTGPATATASILGLDGTFVGIPYRKTSDNSSIGPYSFAFDAAGNFSRAQGSSTPDWSGIYTYTPSSRTVLLDFYSASYGTEYYFTYSPIYVGAGGTLCLDLYTFTPEAGKEFPIGVFSKTIKEKDIQGSTGVGGTGTGLKSESTWSISLTFTGDLKYKNKRLSGSGEDVYGECSMFSSGTWTYDSGTSTMRLMNWDGSYYRDATIKSLALDGKTYYYFSSAIYSK